MAIILFGVDKMVGAVFISMKDLSLRINPYHEWTKTAYILDKCDTECLVVGSSKAERSYVTEILQDSLHMSVYNGGQGGCFFLFQNCVINMLLDRNRSNHIIWDIQPECIQMNSQMQEFQNIRYLSPYYDSDVWVKDYVNSSDKYSALKMQCQMFRYNSKLIQYMMPILGGGKTTQGGYSALPNNGYIYPEMKYSKEIDKEEVKLDSSKINMYKETLDRCNKKGVSIAIFVSPSYSIKSKTYKLSIEKLKDIANSYGFIFNDYSSDNRFLCDSTLFKDASHLNDKGAHKYTHIIANVLKKQKEIHN